MYISLKRLDVVAGYGSQRVEEGHSFNVTSLLPYSAVILQVHIENNPKYNECTTTTLEESE